LVAGRHVAYLEKDATVDYLTPVMDLAAGTGAYVIFRNEVPSLPLLRQIPSRRVTGVRPTRAPGAD